MKYLPVLVFAIGIFAASQALALDPAPLGWKTDFDSAKKAAADGNKLILAYFWFTG